MRIYTEPGQAEFYCDGLHRIHEGKHLSLHPLEMVEVVDENGHRVKHPTGHHVNSKGERIHGQGHHSIVFVWVPGCVHIDDHDHDGIGAHPVLRGCKQGCEDYHHVRGIDPRQAATVSLEVWNLMREPKVLGDAVPGELASGEVAG
jgi:hypothetical protein